MGGERLSTKTNQHEILADIKRVADELGRIPSRDEYQARGEVSKGRVASAFGSWRDAVRALGGPLIEPSRDERALTTQIEKFEERKVLFDRFKSEISPFIGKYQYKPTKEILRIAASSDHHSQFLEEPLFEIYIDHITRLQPEVVALVGDVFDFWAISRYDKDPSRSMSLQSEIDFVTEKIFKRVRKACPNSQIDFFLGNHEARLFSFLSSQARGLSSLKCLQFQNLFKLDELGINLVARESFLSPNQKKNAQNFKVYGDCFVLSHGMSFGKHPAMAELDKYNKSGASGHVHRNTVFSKRDLDGCKTWTSLGTMASLKVGDEYIPDLTNWQQGYQIEHINLSLKKSVSEYVNFNDGFCHAGGVYYETA